MEKWPNCKVLASKIESSDSALKSLAFVNRRHCGVRVARIKHLTNYLKEIVSMRQYNMVDETYIMNEVKEAVCYLAFVDRRYCSVRVARINDE
jgi:hypothetical protein